MRDPARLAKRLDAFADGLHATSVHRHDISAPIDGEHWRAYIHVMKKADVITYFQGVTRAAEALGMTQPAVSAWVDPLPILRQLQIERLTDGKLRADPHCDPFRVETHTC